MVADFDVDIVVVERKHIEGTESNQTSKGSTETGGITDRK